MPIIEKSSKVIEKIGASFSLEPFSSEMDSIIDDVLQEHGKNNFRKGTILIPKLLIWLVLGITLRRDLNYDGVLDWLLSEYRWRWLNMKNKIVQAGTISHARAKLGVAVLRDLFYKHVAKMKDFAPDFHGFVTVMFDGSSLAMPDTESNEKRFGKHKSGRGKGAFPQMRVVALLVLSVRMFIDFAYAPCKGKKTGEKTLMFEILKRCKQQAFLFLFDAGFYSFYLVEFMIENNLHFIMKVSKSLKLTTTSRLADGSYLATITIKVVESVDPITGRKKWKKKDIQIRVIELQIKGFQPVRLITNLMNTSISAKEIAKHYHARWDIEISYDEIKTHQCATLKGHQPTIFRSKRSDLVEQELYAILISYNMVRSIIKEASDREGKNPLFISFLETLQIIIEGGPKIHATMSKKRKEMKLDYMYKMIAESNIDRPRRPRCNPRVVKQKMSNFRKKGKNDKSTIRDFEKDMIILCQEAA